MKKTILTIFIFALIDYSALTSCNSPAPKNDNAGNNAKDTINNPGKDTSTYLTEIDTFKKQNNDSIEANEKSINAFNERIANAKMKDRENYKNEINDLNKKNSDLKRKLDEYKADGKADWKTFKNRFNHDMDELNKSIKNIKDKIV
jgi:seryl-tRNA synthetase